MSDTGPIMTTSVHLVSLGCSRNDVDSEELAARLEAEGFSLVDEAGDADVIMVNTCGFIEQAKKDSIDVLLAAADRKDAGQAKAVVAVGCMAERYGRELAEALPEADAVLGFDDYPDVADRLRRILGGEHLESHVPADRRTLLPLSPIARQGAARPTPGHAGVPDLPEGVAPVSGPRVLRRRLTGGPFAPLKIASGCDRRCSFCAIPSFRGSYLSRRPDEIVAEARWLVGEGVREVMLVSENSSSYGKDLGEQQALPGLLRDLSRVEGLERIRVSYLQPAELRPELVTAMTSIPGVVPYFDLSFQHASPGVLRAMRRFGDADSFLGLIERIRALAPEAGIRSNVIVGFPGETPDDVAVLRDFLARARMDVVGVFGYSDEEGTQAVSLPGHVVDDEIAERVAQVSSLVDELCNQRAEDRVGQRVRVLVEDTVGGVTGRAAHQGPEVDGTTTLLHADDTRVGDLVDAMVVASEGVDLVADVVATDAGSAPVWLGGRVDRQPAIEGVSEEPA